MDVYVVIESCTNLNTANVVNHSDRDQEWILDLGCTFHMTSRKHWLENFKVLNGVKWLWEKM